MADLNDFRRKVEELKAAIRSRLPEVATILTLSTKALAERKIKAQGFGAEYSQEKVPAWFLKGKELNASGASFIADVMAEPDPKDRYTNWGELRAAQGLQTDHVDASYTNKMWAAMGPLEVRETGNVYSAPLGATNREAQNKLNWNRDQYGDFIGQAIGPEEKAQLSIVVTEELKKIIDDSKLIP